MGELKKRKKTPKKRGRKLSSLFDRPRLPKTMKYSIKNVPTHPLKFGVNHNDSFAKVLTQSIGEEGVALFKNTIFGPFLDIPKCNYTGQITKCLLLLEIVQDNPDELHIRHGKGNVLNFGLKEFALVTGLKCTGDESDFTYTESTPSRLIGRYFPDCTNGVGKSRFENQFQSGEWEEIQDAVQMAILYFLHTFVLAQLENSQIPIDDFRMVEDGRYEQYPWGKIAFERLMISLRQSFTLEKQLYRLYGMPYALNIWIYECASVLDEDVAEKERSCIPRILNWRVVGARPKFEKLWSTIFLENACTNIYPTPEELSILDLPGTFDAPPPVPPPSTSNHMQEQHEDISTAQVKSGFDSMSSEIPEQLVRRSRRVSSSASTPPPKRRKKVHRSKPSIPEVQEREQSSDQPHFNEQDLPSLSPHQSPHNVDRATEEVPHYIKNYVDKKFEELLSIMQTNHNEVMKVIRKDYHEQQKEGEGSKVQKATVDFAQTGHADTSHMADHIFEPPSSPMIDSENANYAPIGVETTDTEHDAKKGRDTSKFQQDIVEETELPTSTLHVNELDHQSSQKKDVVDDYEDFIEVGADLPNTDTKPMDDTPAVPKIFEKVSAEKGSSETLKKNVGTKFATSVMFETDSTTSTSISSGTEAAAEVLIHQLPAPIDARPLTVLHPEDLAYTEIPTNISGKEIVVHDDTKTPAQRNRLPSKVFRSPFLTEFGSSDKGKQRSDSVIRQKHPFEGFEFFGPQPMELVEQYSKWIKTGLLKSHLKKNPKDNHYKVNCSSLGYPHLNFVVAHPTAKDWFYLMSEPTRCWNDQHIDVVFYYIRKKSRSQLSNQNRYTTADCMFRNNISRAYERYYCNSDDVNTQEYIVRLPEVAKTDQSISNIIKGFSIPAALPWHLVDEVYIPVNCDGEFHWVLAVVVLKRRLILVYDSSLGSRKKVPSGEIKKLALMLPAYLENTSFYEKTERTDWLSLDAYKDKETGSSLGPQHPFDVEFVQDISQQPSDSLDCGLYVASFAEILSDGFNVPSHTLDSVSLRARYASLLWRYGSAKAHLQYESDNDDPPRPKSDYVQPSEEVLIDVE